MLMEVSNDLLVLTGGAFLLGWIVGKIAGYLGRKLSETDRDPRDARIRSLSADIRVAHTTADKTKSELEEMSRELSEAQKTLKLRDQVVEGQEGIIRKLKQDLKDSVIKTRELRGELAERATENVRSEARLREIETELSVAQASTDMLATGMLDYTTADEDDGVPAFRAGGTRRS